MDSNLNSDNGTGHQVEVDANLNSLANILGNYDSEEISVKPYLILDGVTIIL